MSVSLYYCVYIKYQSVDYMQEQLKRCELGPYIGWFDTFGLTQPETVGRVEIVLSLTDWVELLSCGLGMGCLKKYGFYLFFKSKNIFIRLPLFSHRLCLRNRNTYIAI